MKGNIRLSHSPHDALGVDDKGHACGLGEAKETLANAVSLTRLAGSVAQHRVLEWKNRVAQVSVRA